MTDSWDVIVVGSGAGGAAAAYKLVKAGKRVLMIERCRLPRDRTTLSTKIVFKEGRFANKTEWQDGHGKAFVPNGDRLLSIGVAPSRSAARRVSTSTSAWPAKPFAAVSGPCPQISGSQVRRPSSENLATESVPHPADRGRYRRGSSDRSGRR